MAKGQKKKQESYVVIKDFIDKLDDTLYLAGDVYHGDMSEDRIEELTTDKNAIKSPVLAVSTDDSSKAEVTDDAHAEN